MYVILVYDVGTERLMKVHNFLRTYLHWVQNSVFEGEITNANLERVLKKLKELIDPTKDSIVVYMFRDKWYTSRRILGSEKGTTENII